MVKVLVADDEDMVRMVVKQTLAKAGIDVIEASNGREALEMQANDPADVVITDIIMPEQEGIETIVQLRKDYPDLPIIAMSGGGRIGATDLSSGGPRVRAPVIFWKSRSTEKSSCSRSRIAWARWLPECPDRD